MTAPIVVACLSSLNTIDRSKLPQCMGQRLIPRERIEPPSRRPLATPGGHSCSFFQEPQGLHALREPGGSLPKRLFPVCMGIHLLPVIRQYWETPRIHQVVFKGGLQQNRARGSTIHEDHVGATSSCGSVASTLDTNTLVYRSNKAKRAVISCSLHREMIRLLGLAPL